MSLVLALLSAAGGGVLLGRFIAASWDRSANGDLNA